MRVYYHKMRDGNFGDDLNGWLWQKAIPGLAQSSAADWLIGIGTILDERLDQLNGALLVLGSGYRPRPAPPPALRSNWKIAFVRGPETAKAFGLDPSLAITDPAVLIRRFYQPTEANPAAKRLFYIPHVYTARAMDCQQLCRMAGVGYIDPRLDPDRFLAQLQQADFVIAEAMHGAIAADALGIPWCRARHLSWTLETPEVSTFKWQDWTRSMGIYEYPIHNYAFANWRKRGQNFVNRLALPLNAFQLRKTIERSKRQKNGFIVSAESVREDRIERILSMLAEI